MNPARFVDQAKLELLTINNKLLISKLRILIAPRFEQIIHYPFLNYPLTSNLKARPFQGQFRIFKNRLGFGNKIIQRIVF